ncbi:MAG: threonylcarbamoyl-AMP synthase [Puniceicoccales bacterium]|jgi:L-threonylcarbamoyladenylate synthase|nr:threonylcarbamoyl-AMP synthase [Puniceicoccales bacterium]
MVIDVISLAVKLLRLGEVVVLPTETVYGLAASIKSGPALRKVFQIKGRPLLDPLIVHVLDYGWVPKWAHVDGLEERVKTLVDAFWPGPLTIVLQKKLAIPAIVTAGLDSVAIRCPAHEIFRKVLKAIKIPLAAPSANPFGCLSPTTAQHVKDSLGERVPLIVDGGQCNIGIESTILDMRASVPRILRPGAISASDIAQVIDAAVLDYSPVISSSAVPGQLKQHYSPNTRLVLVDAEKQLALLMNDPSREERAAFVYLKRPAECPYENDVFWLSDDGNNRVAARSLFSILQTLDRAGYDVIYCQKASPQGVGIAVNDRLTRAAAKFSS